MQIGAHSAKLPPSTSGEREIRLFLDASVVECIANDRGAVTTRIYSTNNNIYLSVPDSDLDAIVSLGLADASHLPGPPNLLARFQVARTNPNTDAPHRLAASLCTSSRFL